MRDAPTRLPPPIVRRCALALRLVLGIALPCGLGAQDEDARGAPFPVVFFPPVAPVYGNEIADQPPNSQVRVAWRRLTPPEGLLDLAGDTLYPSLSTRLFARTLASALEEKVATYRNHRNTLVNALLGQLVALQDASEETRERELRRFAATQAAPIAALEKEAETLRHELTRSRFGFDLGWNARRKWKLDTFPPNREPAKAEAEFQVVRAAAFYDEGLAPAQRGLLRELALDLDARARKARGEPSDATDSDAMFFSPETTRLRLPPSLGLEVVKRVAVYNQKKAELKRQLRTRIGELETASSTERAAAFARLADEQWPELHHLEELAEELRHDLAPSFVIAPPRTLPPIPKVLTEIIGSYNEDRDAYYADMKKAMGDARADVYVPTDAEGSEPREQYIAARRMEAMRQAALAFQRKNAERFSLLQDRYREIRSALESIAKTTIDPKTGRAPSVDALLQQHMAAMEEFDRFGRASALYLNYRTAMLQGGLSPEQRRLLFGYAIVGLAQPLPYGEVLPRSSDKLPLLR